MTRGGIRLLKIRQQTEVNVSDKRRKYLFTDLLQRIRLKKKYKKSKAASVTLLTVLYRSTEILQNLLQWKILKIYSRLINIKEMSEADCVAELMKMYQELIKNK